MILGVKPASSVGNNFSGDGNCVSVYNFESGALADDSKGSEDLTPIDDPGADSTNYKQGASSVYFDELDYYLRTDANLVAGHPLKAATGEGDWSIAYWVRPAAIGSLAYHWAKYTGASGDRSFANFQGGGNDISSRWGYNGGDNVNDYDSLEDVKVDKWFHVCQTFTASNDNLFMRIWDEDSTAETDYGPTALSNTPYWGSTEPFAVGASSGGGQLLNGRIDELVIFKDVLSAAECTKIRQGVYP